MTMRALNLSFIFVISLTLGCGGSSGSEVDGSPNGPGIDAPPGGNTDDGGNNPAIDATPGGGGEPCGPIEIQCSNCIDDDGDGLIDGLDPHCVSPLDRDESSFATGIPGDNIDAVKQDCFFDGNSGAGDDGCDIHVCCLLAGECPPEFRSPPFNPNNCTLSQKCIDTCGPATPPGCDCFGCCTICHDNECHDVLINPAVAPDCDLDVLGDPSKCPTCNKKTECSTVCDNSNCILCPGQTPDDLPAECNNQNQCPDGRTPCSSTADCPGSEYCSVGCCITGFVVD
jgi:hypothetical protein